MFLTSFSIQYFFCQHFILLNIFNLYRLTIKITVCKFICYTSKIDYCKIVLSIILVDSCSTANYLLEFCHGTDICIQYNYLTGLGISSCTHQF